MERVLLTIFIGVSIALALVIPFLSNSWTIVHAQNTTSDNSNDTKRIFNLKDNTVTLVNTKTNETISVQNITAIAENMTTNETLEEKFNPQDSNKNAENMTTNETLEEKFKELQN